jgi:hypothetical protein
MQPFWIAGKVSAFRNLPHRGPASSDVPDKKDRKV